jgi:hypothetical protein
MSGKICTPSTGPEIKDAFDQIQCMLKKQFKEILDEQIARVKKQDHTISK